MKRTLTLLLGLGACLFLASAAQADNTKTGKVVEKSSMMNTVTIVTEDGERLTYKTGDATEIQRDGRAVGLDALSQGTSIKVTSTGKPGQGETAQASKIELQKSGASGASGASDVSAPPRDARDE